MSEEYFSIVYMPIQLEIVSRAVTSMAETAGMDGHIFLASGFRGHQSLRKFGAFCGHK